MRTDSVGEVWPAIRQAPACILGRADHGSHSSSRCGPATVMRVTDSLVFSRISRSPPKPWLGTSRHERKLEDASLPRFIHHPRRRHNPCLRSLDGSLHLGNRMAIRSRCPRGTRRISGRPSSAPIRASLRPSNPHLIRRRLAIGLARTPARSPSSSASKRF